MRPKDSPKFIFVCGGVLSGLGKGIASASIGFLLKARGYKVTALKIDPYISIDAGTMRPAEHGETFVTADGGEIDQDLGHYERFINITLTKENNITTGKVYQAVIDKERHFGYEGRDAEMFPDVINQVKEMILKPTSDADLVVVEIGGTTGDLENQPFLHAARELGKTYPSVYIIVTYLPFLHNIGELKTKPTQHAVARLREIGIIPDFIITRNEIPIDKPRIESISKRCFVDPENIIDDPDLDCIYDVPLAFEKSRIAAKILKLLGEKDGEATTDEITRWKKFVDHLKNPKRTVKIGLVGKYVKHGADKHKDVYISVLEALRHASGNLGIGADIIPIDSEEVEKEGHKMLAEAEGIIAPQGWGSRGTEGIIAAAKYARENKIPYLGLCFGMQLATVEFARHVLDLPKANSAEIDPETPDPVIHIMPEQKEYLKKRQYGGTIRLGQWPCRLKEGTIIRAAYDKWQKFPAENLKAKDSSLIYERHRHRYELNNDYRERLEKKGLVISGTSPDGKLVEAIELPQKVHPFFVGTQFHPEYQSRPLSPHPLFCAFLESVFKGSNP